MMLTSCHLTAGFWNSSQGFFALWPLAAACSASISSSSAPRSLLPLSFCRAARTREPLIPRAFPSDCLPLQAEGLSRRWWLWEAAEQSCDHGAAFTEVASCRAAPWRTGGKGLQIPVVWQENISKPCHFGSHASGSYLTWLPWEMQAIKIFLVHVSWKLIPAALYMGICMLQI